MESSFYKNYTSKKTITEPLYTLKEFAEIKGVSYSAISSFMRKAEPKPNVINTRGLRRFYYLKDLESWYKNYTSKGNKSCE